MYTKLQRNSSGKVSGFLSKLHLASQKHLWPGHTRDGWLECLRCEWPLGGGCLTLDLRGNGAEAISNQLPKIAQVVLRHVPMSGCRLCSDALAYQDSAKAMSPEPRPQGTAQPEPMDFAQGRYMS